LTVPPCRCPAACNATRPARATANRRRVPVTCRSEQATARRAGAASAAAGVLRRARPWPQNRPSARSRDRNASATSRRRVGNGRGNGPLGPGSAPSRSRASIARPSMPSARTWCSTSTSPTVPLAGSGTNAAAHSGRDRGNGSPMIAAATSSSACSPPGAGHDRRRTCRVASKRGSSTHTGRPHPNGTRTSRCRRRGTARIRSASTRCADSTSTPGPVSSTSTAPTCSGTAPPLSIASSARSAVLARSRGADCRHVTSTAPLARHAGTRRRCPGLTRDARGRDGNRTSADTDRDLRP